VGRLVRTECRREEVSGNDPGNGDRVKRWETLRFLSVLNLKAECQKRGLKVGVQTRRGLSDGDEVQLTTGRLFFFFLACRSREARGTWWGGWWKRR